MAGTASEAGTRTTVVLPETTAAAIASMKSIKLTSEAIAITPCGSEIEKLKNGPETGFVAPLTA